MADADLSGLFDQTFTPEKGLTEENYAAAASSLGIEIAMIKAVAAVESPRGPFDAQGRPEILFERHYFHRLTNGEFDASDPDISNSQSGGYGKFSAQYGKLKRAYALAPDAALRSASWGRFQIMGENYKAAGFASATAFVQSIMASEAAHLDAFVNFVKHHKEMLSALKRKDWAGFASRYNGPGYRANKYDTKLASEYQNAGGTA